MKTIKAVAIGLATFFVSFVFFFSAVAVGVVVGVAAIVALSASNAKSAIAAQEPVSSFALVTASPEATPTEQKDLSFPEEGDRIFYMGQGGTLTVVLRPEPDIYLLAEMNGFTPVPPFYHHRDRVASYVRASLEAISQGEITLTKVDGFNQIVPIALLNPSVEPTLQVETERVQEIVDVSVVAEQELVVAASPEAIPTPVSPSDTEEMSLEEIKKKIESSTQAALTKWCKELQLKGWRTRKQGVAPKKVMQEALIAHFESSFTA